MAKNSIRDFDNTAGNNTDIQSVDIAENCAPSGINNAIRELMADMADVNDGTVALVSPAMDSADINGGTIDGTVIGGTTPAAGTFTTGDFNTSLNVDGTITSDGLTVDGNFQLNGDLTVTDTSGDPFVKLETSEQSYVLRIDNDASDAFQIRDTTNGANRLTISNSGSVGIGQSVPAGQLHLTSSDITDQVIIENTDTSAAAAPDLVLWKNSSSPADNDALGQVFFRGENSSGTATNYAAIDAVSADVTAGTEDGKLRFQTRAAGSIADRLVIDGQNVGIGTSSPSAILDVGKSNNAGDVDFRFFNRGAGSANSSVTLGMYPTNSATRGGEIITFADDPGSGRFSMRFLTSNTTAVPAERMRISDVGNVGIGTSSPSTTLHVNGGGNNTLAIFESTDAGAAISFKDGNTTTNPEVDCRTNDLTINTSGTERMRIDSSGNVGIGTSSPAKDLHIKTTTTNNQVRLEASAGNINIGNDSTGSFIESTGSRPFRGFVGGSERMRITSGGRIGINETSPDSMLHIKGDDPTGDGASITLQVNNNNTTDRTGIIRSGNNHSGTTSAISFETVGGVENGEMRFYTRDGSTVQQRMTIRSDGGILAGMTSAALANEGHYFDSSGYVYHTRSGANVLYLNRKSTDGAIATFYKSGGEIGAIGTWGGGFYVGSPSATDAYLYFGNSYVAPSTTSGFRDNAIDLGNASARFDDIYATNSTIQTSDRNEKQQIAGLTDAEITAAKAISKLFKTFKWNDKVEAKGEAARTHAGVIAQDVQQAMSDAGLDAANYAFWCSDTWWETQTEVPAVEAVEAQDAVYDDDGNLVSEAVEAVEAQDAYTRTDTYDTAEEAPEGATERTRMGIRYPELLAFIGAATEQRLADIETRLTALEN